MPLRFRSALVPAVNIGSNLAGYLSWSAYSCARPVWAPALPGSVFYSLPPVLSFATQLSRGIRCFRPRQTTPRAIRHHPHEETRGVNQVLNAAALTYVAGLVTAVLQLLYYVLLVGGGGRREINLISHTTTNTRAVYARVFVYNLRMSINSLLDFWKRDRIPLQIFSPGGLCLSPCTNASLPNRSACSAFSNLDRRWNPFALLPSTRSMNSFACR